MTSPHPVVRGPVVDDETRCIHYRTSLDIIAIRFACCREFYPCHLCHAETADHAAEQWPVAHREERAVLCGACGNLLTITEYLQTDACPACAASFNPGCALHTELYFQV
ncbi:CHY zinc finger protein [Microbacterium sp. SS28]|uniref:CHY zinc finger protein n=1 Tax=Microbacterium sp. SS28 TaxID=2919948 RepID=UPI001FAA947A|nr:CHY zinc finger protein [Microbacterium sp. SS28]